MRDALPDERARAGRRDVARGLRALRLRRLPRATRRIRPRTGARVSTELQARARELGAVRELRIVGPDTDLRLGVAGRTWIAADGRFNMPDGEVFTSPIETETEGEIRFSSRRSTRDARSRTSAAVRGRPVVQAEAARGDDYLAVAAGDGRRGARARRGRVRPQLRDRPLHAQHPLRREDRRHDAPRARLGLPAGGRPEPLGPALGHDLRPARRRRGVRGRRARLEGRPVPASPRRSERRMADPRLERLADVLVSYSIERRAGAISSSSKRARRCAARSGALPPRARGRRSPAGLRLGSTGARERCSRSAATPSSTG